jgi:magnesium-transporting ATPase (P-type)
MRIVVRRVTSPQGGSYIDTCNLDGETNLKIKSSLAATSNTQPDKVRPAAKRARPRAPHERGLRHPVLCTARGL